MEYAIVMKDLFRPEDPNLFGTHEIGRWYLKESQPDIVDAAESAKEDAAAEKIAEFMKKFLHQSPDQEGVHYSAGTAKKFKHDRKRKAL